LVTNRPFIKLFCLPVESDRRTFPSLSAAHLYLRNEGASPITILLNLLTRLLR